MKATQEKIDGWLRSRAIVRSIVCCQLSRASLVLVPGVGHVLHDEQAQLVGPVEPAGFFGLDVDADAVEAGELGQRDVALQVFVAGGGVDAVGVERLVERHAKVDRLAIEQDALEVLARQLAPGDGAQAEVGVDRVDDLCRRGLSVRA